MQRRRFDEPAKKLEYDEVTDNFLRETDHFGHDDPLKRFCDNGIDTDLPGMYLHRAGTNVFKDRVLQLYPYCMI
jgi:hypothetical protein